jgi:hypothetical protein
LTVVGMTMTMTTMDQEEGKDKANEGGGTMD